jgi:hypothetical protein
MTASQSSIEIGRRLTVAKATLPHGQLIPWVTATFGFDPHPDAVLNGFNQFANNLAGAGTCGSAG